MNFVEWFTKYITIVFIGICLAFLVSWIQYDSTDLSASVLSLTEQDFFESTYRDAWYKKENQIFEVFLSEKVRNDWPLTVSILFAPSEFERRTDELNSEYYVNIISQNNWNLILNVEWYEKWNFSEWIFQLPFNWESKDVTLEYIKSQNHDFAIWNLDNIDLNNQNH